MVFGQIMANSEQVSVCALLGEGVGMFAEHLSLDLPPRPQSRLSRPTDSDSALTRSARRSPGFPGSFPSLDHCRSACCLIEGCDHGPWTCSSGE